MRLKFHLDNNLCRSSTLTCWKSGMNELPSQSRRQMLKRSCWWEQCRRRMKWRSSTYLFIRTIVPWICNMNMEQRGQLLEIIPHQLFLETPGKTDLVQHHIYLKDSKPIHQHAYRVPEKLLPTMKQEIETMLKLEVIEPSSSEWNNPIVLVPKKDGTLRFCLDFRKLNAVSKFDPYPMPRVDDLIEKLGSAKFLTTLDLCKGYWQIPLSPESKELTAFKTPFGHYHFRVLPFGLHGAPATFQRMIDQILQGTEKFAAAYLDDIIIYSKTWEEHLQHLTEVLERIKSAGLTIRPDKCAMSKTETTYLGYKLGHGVIRPQVGKIEAIKHAERPTSKKQVRSFLGLVGWYRRFIPHFSARAVALTNLTKKDKPNKIDWTAECEGASRIWKMCCAKNLFCRVQTLISHLQYRLMLQSTVWELYFCKDNLVSFSPLPILAGNFFQERQGTQQ